MAFEHAFQVNAPVDRVAAFHRQAASMPAITPPPIVVRIQEAPEALDEGSEMAFTLWLGPLPVRWRARIEEVSEFEFVDRQVGGPFRVWEHRHAFEPDGTGGTRVVDTVEHALRYHPVWGPIGLGMALGLPLLFAYRGWRTRRLLESAAASTSE